MNNQKIWRNNLLLKLIEKSKIDIKIENPTGGSSSNVLKKPRTIKQFRKTIILDSW